MSTTLVSINSNEGRIGRIGWTNQKMWGGKGKIWWSDWWGFPSIRVRREDIRVVSIHVTPTDALRAGRQTGRTETDAADFLRAAATAEDQGPRA